MKRVLFLIIRGLTGLILGSCYGNLVGAVIFLLSLLASPGPMIPDNDGWGRMVLTYATIYATVRWLGWWLVHRESAKSEAESSGPW
jgi:hypothetical protein